MNNTIKTLLNHFPITFLTFVFILRCIYMGSIVNPLWYYANLFSDNGMQRVFSFIAILCSIVITYVFYKIEDLQARIPMYLTFIFLFVLPFILLSMGHQ